MTFSSTEEAVSLTSYRAWKPRQAHVDFGSAGAMKGTKAEMKAHYAKIAAAREASSSRVD